MEKYLYDDLFNLEEIHWWHISKRKTVRSLISKFHKGRKLRILDMGCGTGKNMEELCPYGNVLGVDSSRQALNFCKKRGLANISHGTSYKSGFGENMFDLVTFLDVLEHTDEHRTLVEARRILEDGGEVLITVPAYGWLWSKWDEVLHHRRRYNIKMLTCLLEEEGFKVIKISYLYSFLVIPALFVRFIKKFWSNKTYTSDFRLSNFVVNKIMVLICDIERILLIRFSIPFGTSLVVLAKKI